MAKPFGEVRLRLLRTLEVTVEGDRAKWPKSGLVIWTMQAKGPGIPGPEHFAKVGADGIARCEGLVDGPACLAVMGAKANEGGILWSERATIDGNGQRKITLGEGGVTVKGRVNVPEGAKFDAILFLRADSGAIGDAYRGRPPFTVKLLPGKYNAYLRHGDDCYPLGVVDIKSGVAEPLDLTLEPAKMKNPLNEMVILGLEEPKPSRDKPK